MYETGEGGRQGCQVEYYPVEGGGLLAPDDPRTAATVEGIERELRREGGGGHRNAVELVQH